MIASVINCESQNAIDCAILPYKKKVYRRKEWDRRRENKLWPKSGKGRNLVPDWTQRHVDPTEKSVDTFQQFGQK